jgi:hypothetical protein
MYWILSPGTAAAINGSRYNDAVSPSVIGVSHSGNIMPSDMRPGTTYLITRAHQCTSNNTSLYLFSNMSHKITATSDDMSNPRVPPPWRVHQFTARTREKQRLIQASIHRPSYRIREKQSERARGTYSNYPRT